MSLLVAIVISTTVANAQPATRAGEYAEQQEKKAAAPVGPLRTRAERIAEVIESVGTPPTGWFPFFANIYPGSWFAVGPGYRKPFDSGAVLVAKGAWSVRNFKTVDAQFQSPRFAGNRLHVQADAAWLDAPRLNFFGQGNDTDRDDRVRFALRPITANARIAFTPARVLHVSGGWGVEHYDARPKQDGAPPEMDFTLGVATVSAIADWRPAPGWASSGGAIRFTWKGRRGIGSSDDLAFNEYEGEITELIPILRGNWVIALHGLATTTDVSEGDVPFFMLPSVGGSLSRGFSNFRFRDRHRLAAAAELRWSASQFMDLALFVDTGRVAATRSQLDFDDLHTSIGIGARFHTPASTVFRAEVARSREGLRYTIGAGPVF